jgi:Skp family chaperone for outer membrane proteins
VRTRLIAATTVAIAIAACLFAGTAVAQAPPRTNSPPSGSAPSGSALPNSGPASGAAAGRSNIAVIDVTYILDNYQRLKNATDVFKKELEDAEVSLKRERDAIAKKAELLKTLKPGTPEFKNKEEEIIKAESDWKLRVNRQKGEFAERDAKNFLAAYQELSQQVKVYSERNGISLVIRFNGARVDPNNPQAVQMELSKMVMYYHKDIDITDPILAEMNRSAAVAAPPRGPASPRLK